MVCALSRTSRDSGNSRLGLSFSFNTGDSEIAALMHRFLHGRLLLTAKEVL